MVRRLTGLIYRSCSPPLMSQKSRTAGVMAFHTVGDTGDYRDSGPQDLVAALMTQDAESSPRISSRHFITIWAT